MSTLFPPGRRLQRIVNSHKPSFPRFNAISSLKATFGEKLSEADIIKKALQRVFWMPAVGSKSFLITIADRTVGGLTARDQMVGPWQTPVADVAVTATSFNLGVKTRHGEAMAMGEKPTIALLSPAASARMAVAESLMNIGAADIMGDLRRVKLSANWMAAVNHPGEGAALYDAVEAIGLDMCPRYVSNYIFATFHSPCSTSSRKILAPPFYFQICSLLQSFDMQYFDIARPIHLDINHPLLSRSS